MAVRRTAAVAGLAILIGCNNEPQRFGGVAVTARTVQTTVPSAGRPAAGAGPVRESASAGATGMAGSSAVGATAWRGAGAV
ncbi:hypothetical protein Ait01nite_098090 [Actinoplanes italicus]|nr:hypothetical protein Ait01nite_098090 [Actinoplanes italicus]